MTVDWEFNCDGTLGPLRQPAERIINVNPCSGCLYSHTYSLNEFKIVSRVYGQLLLEPTAIGGSVKASCQLSPDGAVWTTIGNMTTTSTTWVSYDYSITAVESFYMRFITDKTIGGYINGSYGTIVTDDLPLPPVVFDFELSNNYGNAPLTFTVNDITNYEDGSFHPTKWSWYIIYFGCLITTYGHGKEKHVTISYPGQYGLIMTVSDGTTTHTVRKDYCIMVADPNENQTDMVQIEFSTETSPGEMRHNIRTEHGYDDADKNSLSIFLWGTEQSLSEMGENEILKIKTDRMLTRNMTPLIDDIYNLGTENMRYAISTGSDIIMKKSTQSKILRTWSGR